MGTITITVDAGVTGAATKEFTVTNANIGRIAAWAGTAFPNEDGSAPTTTVALERWADWVMATARQQVLDLERRTTAVADFPVA